MEEAINFSGAPTMPIGGFFESSSCLHEAASYFSGYVGHKVNKFHTLKLKCAISVCEGCENIFSTQDLNLHLFISFKEYQRNVDSS
jgi:hypothetical protein